VGAIAMALAIAVGKYSNRPELIRPIGYIVGIFTCVVYVCWSKFARRLWFWTTIFILATVEFALLSRFAQQLSRASAALVMSLGLIAGVANLILVFVIAAQFESGWKIGRRATGNHTSP
jgi:hypothetical protein